MILLAEIDWLSISINLLLVVFVVVCLLMTLLILMQRPKQEGLGAAFGAGVTDQVFGARTTNVLQRGTVYLGSLFFILALTLAVLIGKQNGQTSLGQVKPAEEEAGKPAEQEPAAPAPDPGLPKSLSEELPPADEPAPAVNEPAPAVDEPAPAGDGATPEAPAAGDQPDKADQP